MTDEKRVHSIVLCVKDYYSASGQLILKAGETYPDIEWKSGARGYEKDYGIVWNCPVLVDSPAGKIRLEKEEANEFLCNKPTLEGVLYLQYCQEHLIAVLPSRTSTWAGLVSANGELGMNAAKDSILTTEGSLKNTDDIKKFCFLMASAESEIFRSGDWETCLNAARFMADISRLEQERPGEGRSPFAEILSEYTARLYQAAATRKMVQNGIDPKEALCAFYMDYAENGRLPEPEPKLPGADISLDSGVQER